MVGRAASASGKSLFPFFMKYHFSLAALVIASGALFLARPVGAAVLISDTFSTDHALNASTPDTTVGGATWQASSGTTSGGALSISTTPTAQTAVLDLGANYFSSNPGIYTLSVTATLPSGSGTSWFGIGFVVNPQTNGHLASTTSAAGLNSNGGTNGGSPWMFLRQNGQTNVYRGSGTGSNLLNNGGPFASGTAYTMKLVLDTSVANWTLDAFIDSTQLDLNGAAGGNTAVFSTNPTDLRYVGISQNGGSFGNITVDNFSLAVVPEPTALLPLALSASLFLVFRRKR